ncbi:ArsR/SmtB family transcription factor [Lacrimispora aerotolerans]|uniref:ArsR/SmtB family transcription factor n=1 Tax=Lacrimispora aerotolerans TaxID=36832 RepID=UPI0005590392|nr:winged helix-turn-helix domain-containing protein [Lacrimispora aerotolerans]
MDPITIVHIITDPTRYKILTLLMERHFCVRAVSKKLGISEPAVSQQMNILKKAGVITGSKMGYHMHYTVNTDLVNDMIRQFAEGFTSGYKKEAETEECICEYECGKKH